MDFSHISFYALSGLVNFFTSLIIGLLVYLPDRKNQANIGFAIFAGVNAAWSILYFFFLQAIDKDLALLLMRILIVPTLFISVGFFHFVIGLLGTYERYKSKLKWSYLLFLFFFLFDFSPLLVKDVGPILDFRYWPQPGMAFHPFLALWLLYFLYATILLLKSYKNVDSVKKAQIKYVFIGIVIAFITGSTNWLLWYGIEFPPLTIGLSFYVVMIGYAALKHHLFNIRIIAVELLTFVIWASLLIRILTTGQSGNALLSDIGLLISVIIIGLFLIRAGLKENKLNEKLDDLNQNLQKKVDQQTKEIRTAYEVEKTARVELENLNSAKNGFILAAQHNLRTPLTVAKGYNQEAISKVNSADNAALKEYLGKTSVALDETVQLVNQLLDVTELEVKHRDDRKSP